jgi:hypothetical protein
MSEHKHVIKFDVKTYPCKCGLEFSQELAETLVEAALSGSLPTVQLGIDLEFERRKVAELKAYIDQLIEIGGWAITGMTIATSYSPGEMQNLAEKKSDDWYALIKNLKECDKEKECEE